MGEKSTLQLCAPLISGVIVIIAFYILGALADIIDHILKLHWDLPEFFYIFGEDRTTGGLVVAIIVWIILTVWMEISISEE